MKGLDKLQGGNMKLRKPNIFYCCLSDIERLLPFKQI